MDYETAKQLTVRIAKLNLNGEYQQVLQLSDQYLADDMPRYWRKEMLGVRLMALTDLGALEQAHAELQTNIALFEDTAFSSSMAHQELGQLSRDLGDIQRARDSFLHAIVVAKDDPGGWIVGVCRNLLDLSESIPLTLDEQTLMKEALHEDWKQLGEDDLPDSIGLQELTDMLMQRLKRR